MLESSKKKTANRYLLFVDSRTATVTLVFFVDVVGCFDPAPELLATAALRAVLV